MHGLIALFCEVIVLGIILLLIGLVALIVLLVAMRIIVLSVVSMTIVDLLVVAIALVTSMIVTLLAMKLPVDQITAARDGKMSRLLLFWLLLVLGDLFKDAGRFIGSLTLLKKQ